MNAPVIVRSLILALGLSAGAYAVVPQPAVTTPADRVITAQGSGIRQWERQQSTMRRGNEATVVVPAGGTGKAMIRGVAVFISDVRDSRCPQEAVCVWAGEVRVALTVQQIGQVKQAYPDVRAGADLVTYEGWGISVALLSPQFPYTEKSGPYTFRVAAAPAPK